MRNFTDDRRGNVAMIFALALTGLVGLVGGGVDYARLVNRRSQLQAAVDAGVLTGGNALKLAATNIEAVMGATEQAVRDAAKPASAQRLTVRVVVPPERTSVFARAEETVRLSFGAFLGISQSTVSAQAQVNVVGKMRLCMLTLDPAAQATFHLNARAQVTASNCTLYSNSKHADGMVGESNAQARAETICSSGGFRGLRANFVPTPQTGCPVIEDPLKDRPEPDTTGDCKTLPSSRGKSENDRQRAQIRISGRDTVDLEPGVYCNGLRISGRATVRLKPGIYIFRNGPLYVTDKAVLSGTSVGLFFTGPNGGLLFNDDTTISLTAPTTGPMSGILLSEERNLSNAVDPATDTTVDEPDGAALPPPPPSPTPPPLGASQPMRTYRIISNNARTMLGTIYLPAGRLVIDSETAVADQSAYTVVVARQVSLYKGPNLVLNANYDRTSVPVPKGVGPIGGKLILSQ